MEAEEKQQQNSYGILLDVQRGFPDSQLKFPPLTQLEGGHMSMASQKLQLNPVRWSNGTSEALTLIINSFRDDLYLRCIHPQIRKIILCQFNASLKVTALEICSAFYEKDSADSRVNPNQPWSTDHSTTLEEELLIISSSHSFFSRLPNQNRAALALQGIPFFPRTLLKWGGCGIQRHLKESYDQWIFSNHQWIF